MRAVRLHEIGGPEKLVIEDVPQPEPGSGETVVRLHAAAFNHRDVYITQGLYAGIALPCTLGSDGCGECAGKRVVINPMLDWGDDPRVWSARSTILGMPRDGTFAQYVSVPEGNVHPAPAHLSDPEAAALPLAGLTAYRALFTRGELHSGQTVLLTGVGGGVSSVALLFAKAAGARAIVTSGSDEKLEHAKTLGADVLLNYRNDENWQRAARDAGPIDLAVDSSGGPSLGKLIAAVRPGGRIVVYGGTTGNSTIKMYPLFWNQVSILGTSMGSPSDFAGMLEFVNRHRIVPVVDRVFAMDDVVEAARRIERGEQFGRVVLAIP